MPASPWTIQNGGLGLRLDWEDDNNCAGFNPNTQRATATAAIVVPVDTIMTVTWSGVGETEAPNFELMSLSVDGMLVGEAHAPGGNQGCGPMGPVVSDPPPPQQVMLTPRRAFPDHHRDDQRPAVPRWSVPPVRVGV